MAELGRQHVLIAGVTTRPLAVSAARAGYRVTAIDPFGDVDLRAVAEVMLAGEEPGRFHGPTEAVLQATGVAAELVAYTSNFENYPRAVAGLSENRELLGNAADILVRVRNPARVMSVLRKHGLAVPETRTLAPDAGLPGRSWLLKPRKSGGGHGIRLWARGDPVPKGMYLQERLAGTPGSISFAADGRAAAVLGFSRQLVGDPRFGARRYRYCGSILGRLHSPLFSHQDELLEKAGQLVGTLVREFRLVGLNGIDFIARHGVPYPLEVNPRYSSSMELIERAQRISMFEVHSRACRGMLPAAPASPNTVQGKAIVFARRAVRVGNPSGWADQTWVADIPHRGDRIQRGRPICTVFAAARDPEACRRLLWRRAAAVYRALKSTRRQAA
jgi:uncharacterized protein